MNRDVLTREDELRALLKECVTECITESFKSLQSTSIPESPLLVYSLRELASFLGCSIGTVQKLKNSGKIRYKQFGRKCVFNTNEVLEDINKNKGR